MARTVDDLAVYQKALQAPDAVSALLKRPAFVRDREIASQLNRCSVRVASDIAEGFEQKTDKGFARYLYDARGSAQEARTQLRIAAGRGHLTVEDSQRVSDAFLEIGRMLSGLIVRLELNDRKNRRG